jgi:hypothetical protein
MIVTNKKTLRIIRVDSDQDINLDEYTPGIDYKARLDFVNHVCSTINPIDWYDQDKIRLVTNQNKQHGMKQYLPNDINYVYNVVGYNQKTYDFLHNFVVGDEIFKLTKAKADLLYNDRFLKIIGWYDSITMIKSYYESQIEPHILDILYKRKKLKEVGYVLGITESRMCQIVGKVKNETPKPTVSNIVLNPKIESLVELNRSNGIEVQTPWGKFKSLLNAYNSKPTDIEMSFDTLRNWCKNNRKRITIHSYKNSKFLLALGNVVGKTYRQLGFYVV